VDSFDLATLAALRYARSLRPTTLRAVHFVIDGTRAEALRQQWIRADRGVVLDFVDVPDRRLVRAAADLVCREIADPGTHVTVILPRRSFSPLLGRFLHDRTADKIAGAVSRIPRSAATIIPFDVQSRVELLQERQAAKGAKTQPAAQAGSETADRPAAQAGTEPVAQAAAGAPAAHGQGTPDGAAPAAARHTGRGKPDAAPDRYRRPVPSRGVNPIGSLAKPGKATVEGRVRSVEIRPVEQNSVLAADIADSTGELTALFYGRSRIPGLICGARVRFRGPVGIKAGRPFMVNPTYELLAAGPDGPGTPDA
jgi:hypothetical protein